MPRVEPLDRSAMAEFEPAFEQIEQAVGFVPNSMLTMGRSPELLRGFAALSGAVLSSAVSRRPWTLARTFLGSLATVIPFCTARWRGRQSGQYRHRSGTVTIKAW